MTEGINTFTDEDAIRRTFEEEKAIQKQCFLDGDVIRFDVGASYKVALDRCDTPEKILDWVDHLCSKTWMTPELIQRFLALACGSCDIKYQDIT